MTHSITRREVLAAGVSVAVGLCVPIHAGRASTKHSDVVLSGWIRINPAGAITLLVNSTEMGQGATSALAQILAEELELEWLDVRVAMAPVERFYYGMWGTYQTGGSGTIRGMFEPLRRAGAVARSKLILAAAQLWNVPARDCRAQAGKIHGPSGLMASYGELAERAAKIEGPKDVSLKPRDEWTLIGKPLRRLDMQAKSLGSAVYGVDVHLPKMLHAAVSQCPTLGGSLASFDKAAAEDANSRVRMLGVNGALVAVAPTYWQAYRALQAAHPKWNGGHQTVPNSEEISRRLHELVGEEGRISVPNGHSESEIRENHEKGINSAVRFVEATYEAPLLAHQTMEPMNATAWVHGGRAELWVPTQAQSDMREAVAKALGIPPEAVTINTTDLGGGFGRRLKVDYGVQAALIARHFDVPVQLLWSREEDTKHDFYRPAAVANLRAGLDPDGNVCGLRARIACLDGDEPIGGLVGQAYDLRGMMATYTGWNPGVPIGAWRSVDASQNLFFWESFVDEIAYGSNLDPLALRRQLLSADVRALRVLEAAVMLSEWEKPLPKGRGRGIAFLKGYGSLSAQVVEVSVDEDRTLRVHRISCAIDCGIAVNPDSVRAQFEGGALFALSAALFGEITIRDGSVEQSNFDSARVLRIDEVPDVQVAILESPDEKIGGVGEPPVPPVAPALANAIFAASGVRVRQLPLSKAGFKVGKRIYA